MMPENDSTKFEEIDAEKVIKTFRFKFDILEASGARHQLGVNTELPASSSNQMAVLFS